MTDCKLAATLLLVQQPHHYNVTGSKRITQIERVINGSIYLITNPSANSDKRERERERALPDRLRDFEPSPSFFGVGERDFEPVCERDDRLRELRERELDR
ncbi:hypothetical protein X798_03195 [Onchocerca flexuosa]|uniref:Transposase n=2 Tax=Onchocerca flexuosa TaxID=387005 RepID=A0A183I4U0_9BILA|nr:hypothetical protein X798_03195 [Onchocerca flexuosa]VDP18595.1 unnamed protein product [Onchocerca flexuosa]